MKQLSWVVIGIGAIVLSGCSAPLDLSNAERVDGVPSTINAAELAGVAEGIVLEQGFAVEIDCGSDDVPFVVGTSLECAAFDPASETSGAYTVTIDSIEGTDYVLNVVGSESTPAPEPASALESAAAFASLTADAITDSLGEVPVVDCGTADIEIFTGQEVRCAYTTSTATGFVLATVTSFDGSFYEISVVEE